MADRWTVTVRRRGRTEREQFDAAAQAFAAAERQIDALARTEGRATAKVFAREIEPVAQVAARIELAGPGGQRGGVDLRGDGSAEAFTGRWRKQVVEARRGEDAVAALRRALGG
ncbi:MAG TPA: hypothetical protein VD931_19660 [Baekduia sp.]|nr:hypothetical protein [Baekduia sp.]